MDKREIMVKSDKTKFREILEQIRKIILNHDTSTIERLDKVYRKIDKLLNNLKELFLTQEMMSKDNITRTEILALAKTLKRETKND